jgi:hypothetical protein
MVHGGSRLGALAKRALLGPVAQYYWVTIAECVPRQ